SSAATVTADGEVHIRTRDPYIFNLFEVLLTTLESKLRRVENMDKALERLVRRLDTMEERLAQNFTQLNNKMSQVLESKPESTFTTTQSPFTARRNRVRVTAMENSSSETTHMRQVEQRLKEMTEHVEKIDTKLTNIGKTLDSNALTLQDELVVSASENYRAAVPRVQVLDKNPGMAALQQSVESVREEVSSMDRRLSFHMEAMADTTHTISSSVIDIHQALHHKPSSGRIRAVEANSTSTGNANTTISQHNNKIDELLSRMDPFTTVWKKMAEVWDVVVGTKSSVDHLVPNSDALLSTSQRQARSISDIHSELNEKTNRIIMSLAQVEEVLKAIPTSGKSYRDSINPLSLLRHSQGEKDEKTIEQPSFDMLDKSFLSDTNGSDLGPGSPDSRGNSHRDATGTSGLVFPSIQNKPDFVNSTFLITEDDIK
ncbi:unnamed protein product, partial [Meganyctiphanes norvegica]